MSEAWRETEYKQQMEFVEKLKFYLKGNMDAVRFCVDVIYIGHLWDDIHDRDKDRTKEEIEDGFRTLLGHIPTNPFYRANISPLHSLIMSAVLQWEDANKLSSGNDDEKLTSFICRNAMVAIIHYCLFLVGGYEWAKEHGADFFRESYRGVHPKYLEFLEEVS